MCQESGVAYVAGSVCDKGTVMVSVRAAVVSRLNWEWIHFQAHVGDCGPVWFLISL